jgi:YD repeat-containing protein
VATPAPGTGESGQTTTTDYDTSLRAWRVSQPDGGAITNEFYPTGQTKRAYGARTYPVGYGYDAQGRMTTMTNWTSFVTGTGTRVTTWNYNQYRGWMDNKRYTDNVGPSYTYTPAGRLQTRLWARGTNTTYTYDKNGQLATIGYSDGATSGGTNGYDRRGRRATITVGTHSTVSLTYNDAGQILREIYAGGTLNGLIVTNAYDSYLRRISFGLSNQPATVITYAYDNASRLASVGNGAHSATYSYLANSRLVSQITMKSNTTISVTTTKQHDNLDRLRVISNQPSAAGEQTVSFAHEYNSCNQRSRVLLADGSFWVHEFDHLGQVVSGKRFWSDWAAVAGQHFEYVFDDIGNRTSTKTGGDETCFGLRLANYNVNSLNQYTNRDVPDGVDIIGLELATNSLTVNGATPYRRMEYFRKQLSVSNTSTSVWQSVNVSAPNETPIDGNIFVPKTAESFVHDSDGNLISDGRWNYTWDAENRLIRMVANTSMGPQQRLEFEYDSRGRRIGKKVWNNIAGTNSPDTELKFVYDGWNLLATLASDFNPLMWFTWGPDLSGSLQGPEVLEVLSG